MSWLGEKAEEMFEQVDAFEKLDEIANLPAPSFRPSGWSVEIDVAGRELFFDLCRLCLALESSKEDLAMMVENLRKHRSKIDGRL